MDFQLPSLRARNRLIELMDQPNIDTRNHRRALSGLRRINAVSLTGRAIWARIQQFAQRECRPLRVLDLACGGGDLAIWLARQATRHGLALHVAGCDISPVAVAHAREEAQKVGDADADFFVLDALSADIPDDYDVVMTTLFLHHLDHEDAVALLRRAAQSARTALLVDDLERTSVGYLLAWAGCRLLSRSPIVHYDGPASVRGAFSYGEVKSLLREAGLENAMISRHWPERFLISWSRS